MSYVLWIDRKVKSNIKHLSYKIYIVCLSIYKLIEIHVHIREYSSESWFELSEFLGKSIWESY